MPSWTAGSAKPRSSSTPGSFSPRTAPDRTPRFGLPAACFASSPRRALSWNPVPDRERATTAIGFIHQLYTIDKATKELPPSRRTEQRRKAAEPVLDAFRGWLQAQDLLVLPKSPIAIAVGYALNQWTALTRFLDDGRLRLDNNRSELELRREAMGGSLCVTPSSGRNRSPFATAHFSTRAPVEHATAA
ncbi:MULTISPECIES: IS66 family transposase [Sorangium]|uniref:IS66 family transposase n=1 Tax=Sorangium TaxID=39643 RepID=UPI00214F915F|nr:MULTISPECIES: IS66 family transposase [Sorangium]